MSYLEKLKKRVLERYRDVETDINVRWEKGFPHHPKSKELFQTISDLDFVLADDYFRWKSGGDGDNGETLMYLLDIHFEQQDIDIKRKLEEEIDLSICPGCGGDADQGFDRCMPPSPYLCSKCNPRT